MKIFLKRSIWFLLIALFIFPIFTVLLEIFKPNGLFLKVNDVRGETGFTWTRLREAEKTSDIDVLILGSSLAYRGIDTRAFDSLGIKAFNLGTSAQTPVETEYIIQKYLERLNPKLIIWDLSPSSLMDSGFESFLDLCSNDGVDSNMINLFYRLKRFDAISTLLAVGIKRSLFSDGNFIEPQIKRRERYISGGFVEREIERVGRYPNLPFVNFSPKLIQIQAINRIFQQIKERNIKIILVAAPIHPDKYRTFLGLDYHEELVGEWVGKYSLIGFWDFNKMDINPQFYYDQLHLNKEGVDLYNTSLVNQLKPFLLE